jgi:hypothetical protein
MVAVRRAPTTSPLGHILSVLDEDGGLVVEGMFDPEHISALRRAVLGRAFGYGAARDAAPGTATQGIRRGDLAEFVGRNTVRFSSLGSLAPDAFFGMLRTPLFRAVADAMLLPYCGSYWLNTGQAMLIGPQSEAQELHRDADNWPEVTERLWPQCPELTVSCMIALEAVSRDIGATRIVPGSVSCGPEQEPWSRGHGARAIPTACFSTQAAPPHTSPTLKAGGGLGRMHSTAGRTRLARPRRRRHCRRSWLRATRCCTRARCCMAAAQTPPPRAGATPCTSLSWWGEQGVSIFDAVCLAEISPMCIAC